MLQVHCGRQIATTLNHLGIGPHAVQDELDIMAYNLNDSSLVGKIIEAAQRGVRVRILLNGGSFDANLRRPVRRFNTITLPADQTGNLKRIRIRTLRGHGQYGVMHHKVMLMRMVNRRNELFFGSFNFSNNAAQYNYENCARARCVHNVPANDQIHILWNQFDVQFGALWALGQSAGANY